jgi:hypothetical protein
MRTRSCTANMVCSRCTIPEVDATPLEAVEKAILLCRSICYLTRATSYEPWFSAPGGRHCHQLDHLSSSGSTQSGPLFKKRASSKNTHRSSCKRPEHDVLTFQSLCSAPVPRLCCVTKSLCMSSQAKRLLFGFSFLLLWAAYVQNPSSKETPFGVFAFNLIAGLEETSQPFRII